MRDLCLTEVGPEQRCTQIAYWTSVYERASLASALPSSGVNFPVRGKKINTTLKRVNSA